MTNFEIVPEPITFTPPVRSDLWGRIELQALRGRGARIRSDSTCIRCGQRFKAGDDILAHLRENWDEAPAEHQGDCPQ